MISFAAHVSCKRCKLLILKRINDDEPSGRIRSAGLPGPLQEVKIVDDYNSEVPRGTVDEIIARGYMDDEGFGQRLSTMHRIPDNVVAL